MIWVTVYINEQMSLGREVTFKGKELKLELVNDNLHILYLENDLGSNNSAFFVKGNWFGYVLMSKKEEN